MRRSLVVVALACVLAAGLLPASAHTLTVGDPEDTQGRLDVREVALLHKGDGGDFRYIWIVRTYDKWFPRHVAGDKGSIAVLIKRSPESSWRLEIKKRSGGGLRAHLSMCIEGQGCGMGDEQNYNVTRPNKKSARVKVPSEDLGGVGNRLRFLVNTAFGDACEGNCYFDRVPDEGLAKHNLDQPDGGS